MGAQAAMPRLEESAAYRPKRIYSLPSHNSKTVLSTVYVGGPILTIGRTGSEMWLGDRKSTETLDSGIVA